MNYKEATDLELWQCCQNDDLSAYNELFSRYFARMFHVANAYVPDAMQAEELCMDQLFYLWVKRKEIRISESFSGYIFTSVRHRVISEMRKSLPEMNSLNELAEEQKMEPLADSTLIHSETDQAYRAALSKLSPRRREVFLLSREENLSYPEIARKTNLSVNTVENYMVAALGCLRRDLREHLLSLFIPLLVLAG